jgi:pyruvate dehydrogenase E1 component alpha subunit
MAERDRPTLDSLCAMYRVMTTVKQCDERLRKGMRTGQFAAIYFPPRGQEAIAGALSQAVRSDDYLVTTYRGMHLQVAKGVPLRAILGEMFGREGGVAAGKGGSMHIADPDHGLLIATSIVGAGIPIGAGAALASALRGEDRVTVTSFGDGAANTGAFHEGFNLAAVWNLPIVYVCENNRYAEMTAAEVVTRNACIADRGPSYGMPA